MMIINENSNELNNVTTNQQRKIAIIAAMSLLLMIISIILAEVVAMGNIIVEENIVDTVTNISNSQGHFRFGIIAYMGVAILDMIVAWAFFVFLKPAKDDLSILVVWSRLIYTAILCMAIVNLYKVVQLLGQADFVLVLEKSEIQTQVNYLINAFHDTWHVGYIFFGIHLLLLGVVTFRSGFVPKIMGIILIVAGTSYLIDYVGGVLFPELPLGTSLIFGYGELLFMVWLFIWGGKTNNSLIKQNNG